MEPFEIEQKIIEKASRCDCRHACLSKSKKLCEIREVIAGGFAFLNTCHNKFCAYRIDYGGHDVCTCPVRNAIFIKYKI